MTRKLFDALEPDRVGVVPYRIRGGELEVLLITSKKKKRWIVPKGKIEDDLGLPGTAAKEAFEEAGVRGRLGEEPIGCYRHGSSKKSQLVELYLMRVDEEARSWPEEDEREREWLPVAEARERVAFESLGAILEEGRKLLSLAEHPGLQRDGTHPAVPA